MRSALRGWRDAAFLLMKNGANRELVDRWNETAEDIARRGGHSHLAQLIHNYPQFQHSRYVSGGLKGLICCQLVEEILEEVDSDSRWIRYSSDTSKGLELIQKRVQEIEAVTHTHSEGDIKERLPPRLQSLMIDSYFFLLRGEWGYTYESI